MTIEGTEQGDLSAVVRALEGTAGASYILDSQFRIIYCNPAWNYFAESNGARQLTGNGAVGLRLFDAIPDVLRVLYSQAFQRVLVTGEVWEQVYECSSPTLFRKFRMRIHLLTPQNWFLVTNTPMVERLHDKAAVTDRKMYRDADGMVKVCAHCRCSQRLDAPAQWDFVPEHLQRTSAMGLKVSHGLCPLCRAYFYPQSH